MYTGIARERPEGAEALRFGTMSCPGALPGSRQGAANSLEAKSFGFSEETYTL